MFMLPLFALLQQIAELTPFSPTILPSEISSFWWTLIAITHSGTQKVLLTRIGYLIGSSPLTFSPSMTLTYLLFSIAPLAVVLLLTSPLLPPLSPSYSWEVLQDLGSDHLPILLTIPLSSVFRPNEHPPSFNSQKAHWDDFAFYFDSYCPYAEEYSSLFFSSAAALSTSLTLNAAKSSIPLGCIKRHLSLVVH